MANNTINMVLHDYCVILDSEVRSKCFVVKASYIGTRKDKIWTQIIEYEIHYFTCYAKMPISKNSFQGHGY